MIQPTADELKNGWTAEKLTAYVDERNRAALDRAGYAKPRFYHWGQRPEGRRNRPTRTVSVK